MKIDVFISSNQSEFSEERKYIADNIKNDSSLNNYFNIYLFEEDLANKLPSDRVFTNRVEHSDIYIGLIGNNYDFEYVDGISATEFEFMKFNAKNRNSFFFVRMDDNADEKSKEFFNRIKDCKKYKRFSTKEELVKQIKSTLIRCMIENSKQNIFDAELIESSTYDDVDENAVISFYNVLKDDTIKLLFKNRDFKHILECIGAGKIDEKGVFRLNTAGALFFAKNLSKFNLNFEIKMARFDGTTRRTFLDKLEIHKSIFYAIDEFENFFKRNTKTGTIVKGLKSYDIPEYPLEAVREAFINAIAHRDYSLTEDCITFYIYDDRIVITSPGGLPYPLTIEDLNLEVNPKHRNKSICRIFKYTKYMEHFGTGITRMREEMLESGLKEPEFINTNYFTVILRGPNGELIVTDKYVAKDDINLDDYQLNKRQIKALKLMCNENQIFTYKSYSKYFSTSLTTAKRDLNNLFNQELVIRFNGDKIYKFSSNKVIKNTFS